MFGFRNPVGSTHNPNILVTEGDTWTGFYAAWSLLRHHRGGHDSTQGTPAPAPTGQPGITPTHHGHVNKVIVGVRDSNSDFAKELHKLGAELREYDPYNMDKEQIQKHLLRNDVDGVAFVPVHDSIGHMININKMLLRAFEEEERCKCLVMWSSIGTQIHPGSGHDDDEDVLAKSKGKSSTATRTSATGGGMPSWGQLFENKSQIERAVRNSKFEHECILRIGFVSQQFFGLSNVIQSRGMFPVTSRSNKWAPINAKDVAMVSGALLANPSLMSKFTKQTLVLTGPQSHSGKDMVTVINSTLNAKLSLEEVSLKDLETILLDQEDVPNEGELAMTLGYYHYIKENKLDIVSNDANKVLGRVPSDIDVFFKENGNLFRPRRNVNATPYLKDLKQ